MTLNLSQNKLYGQIPTSSVIYLFVVFLICQKINSSAKYLLYSHISITVRTLILLLNKLNGFSLNFLCSDVDDDVLMFVDELWVLYEV